jgi:hypothetical protein
VKDEKTRAREKNLAHRVPENGRRGSSANPVEISGKQNCVGGKKMKDIIKRQVLAILASQAISGKCRIVLNGRAAEICNVDDSVYVDGDGVLVAECLRIMRKDKAGTINKVNTCNYLRTMGEKR